MSEIIQGERDDLVTRDDLRGRMVRVIVLDAPPPGGELSRGNLSLEKLRAWADSQQPVGHSVDDSRESIYHGTVDDPR